MKHERAQTYRPKPSRGSVSMRPARWSCWAQTDRDCRSDRRKTRHATSFSGWIIGRPRRPSGSMRAVTRCLNLWVAASRLRCKRPNCCGSRSDAQKSSPRHMTSSISPIFSPGERRAAARARCARSPANGPISRTRRAGTRRISARWALAFLPMRVSAASAPRSCGPEAGWVTASLSRPHSRWISSLERRSVPV